MTTGARTIIDSHSLMRTVSAPASDARVELSREKLCGHATQRKELLRKRTFAHIGIFLCSFIFTTGFLVLSVLLWVRPDALEALVLTGILSAGVFVSVFSVLRVLMVRYVYPEYTQEEDPGMQHHVGKSVTYGFLALVIAGLLLGILVNVASAFTM